MSIKSSWKPLAIALLGVSAAIAADTANVQPDQIYYLEASPDVIDIPKIWCAPATKPPTECPLVSPAELTQEDVVKLLGKLVPGGEDGLKDDTYYVLHLVHYPDGSPASADDAWYAYFKKWSAPSRRTKINDPEWDEHYKQARLFGAKKLSFIYLHYGVPVGKIDLKLVEEKLLEAWTRQLPTKTGPRTDDPVNLILLQEFWKAFGERYATDFSVPKKDGEDAKMSDTITGIFSENATKARTFSSAFEETEKKLAALAPLVAPQWLAKQLRGEPGIVGPRGQSLQPIGSYYVESDFLPLTYKIDIVKKKPSWQTDLGTIISLFAQQNGMNSLKIDFTEKRALRAAKLDMQIDYPTSDITITGVRGKRDAVGDSSKAIGTKVYDNEQRYRFDFGFVIPVKTIKELKFNSEGRLVQPKPVEKANVYGTVGFFPLGKVDTKAERLLRLSPEILYGMSLNSTPWNNHLFGVALGLKWVQPYVGVTGTRSAIAAEDGTIGGYKWNWKLSYGIQVPVKDIANFFK